MRRELWALGGVGVLACVTWACWPEDEVVPTGAESAAVAEKPTRSLAEQLDDVARALEASDAGRGVVSGIIEDETGQPVAGAEVRVYQTSGSALEAAVCPVCEQPILECLDVHTARELVAVVRSGKGQPKELALALSGPDGTFHFADLPQEDLDVIARKGALIGRSVYSPGEEPVVMIFEASRLSLRVVRMALDVDAPAVPLAGAQISAISLDTFRIMETVSDSTGQVRVDGLDEGSGVWVLLEAPGLVPHVGVVFSDQDDTELALTPARTLLVRTAIGGKPADAKVTLTPGSGQHPVVQQTQGGHARFEGLGDEGYDVTAMTQALVAPNQLVMLENDLTTLDLELRVAARVLVTVIDELGEPVSSVDVTASGREGDSYAASSSDGSMIVLGPLGEGPITLDVTTSDFRPWHRELDLHPGDNVLEVVVKKGVKLRGQVVDADGAPVAQAEVEALAPINQPAVAYSDFDGFFELTFDEAGPQQLTASLSAVGRTVVNVSAPADNVIVRLEQRARLKVFLHEGSTPVAAVSVTVSPLSGDDIELSATSGEDGHATLSGLDTGSYRVVVQSPDFRPPSAVVAKLTEGRTLTLDIALDRGLTLAGIVVDSRGAPVSRADVSTNPWSTISVTDEDGRFTLTTLDPLVSYRLEASTEHLHSAALTVLGAQPPLKLVMQARPTLTGRVVDGTNGRVLNQFDVDSRTIESPDGRFSVPVNVVEGESAIVSISADGYETFTWQGTLASVSDLGTVRLQKAKIVEGVVRDIRGNPVPGALVSSDYTADEVTSAADGTFRLALSLYEAGVTLTAERGQLRGSAPAVLGSLTEIVLSPPTKVTGQVVDANGRPVAGSVTGREISGGDEVQFEASSDGAFSVDVAAGRWVFITRVSSSGQTFAISGASMRITLGAPPGSCSVVVQTSMSSSPDELLLVPGDLNPAPTTSTDVLTAIDGAVLFDTVSAPRTMRAGGFRCGLYTLVARWGLIQHVQRLELRSESRAELQLPAPPELASAPDLGDVPR